MKIKYQKIAKSLIGFSTPFFGVSWNPPETDRNIVRKLIIFLEDRRVLYSGIGLEEPWYAIPSVDEIRKTLTQTIQIAGDDSDITDHLRAMRAACRKFMNELSPQMQRGEYSFNSKFISGIGVLRAVFGIQIAQLAVKYGIDVEKELASILPREDK